MVGGDAQAVLDVAHGMAVYNLIFKLAGLAVGFGCIWMGYRLFVLGILEGGAAVRAGVGAGASQAGSTANQDIANGGVLGGRSFKSFIAMDRGGPGLLFALFGAGVIVSIIFKSTSVEVQQKLPQASLQEGFSDVKEERALAPEPNLSPTERIPVVPPAGKIIESNATIPEGLSDPKQSEHAAVRSTNHKKTLQKRSPHLGSLAPASVASSVEVSDERKQQPSSSPIGGIEKSPTVAAEKSLTVAAEKLKNAEPAVVLPLAGEKKEATSVANEDVEQAERSKEHKSRRATEKFSEYRLRTEEKNGPSDTSKSDRKEMK